jgi:antitoxin (DNA-binding transcriptional repressor) of toxin-antitoxin stability system
MAGRGGKSLICQSVLPAALAAALAVLRRQAAGTKPPAACFAAGRPRLSRGYAEAMSELPVDGTPGVAGAAREAARGHVVYLTEHGERLAAIVPAEFAEALEGMSEEDARELLEDLADAAAARQALAEPGESIPWEQVRAEAGL